MKALVCGLGRMGSFHAKVLADLGYEITSVDPDPSKGADHATIAEAMLSSLPPWQHSPTRFDVAAIATPADQLLPSAFALAGIPMLVEKPFALNSRDAHMLAAYLHRAGKPVCVGYVERFNPQVRAVVAEIARHPRVEAAVFARLSDRPSWNPSLDLKSHDVDLAIRLHIPLDRCVFDTDTEQPYPVRSIALGFQNETDVTFDLMDHTLSPLHAMWHAFLTGKPVPTPEEAARVLEVIEQMDRTPTELEAAA